MNAPNLFRIQNIEGSYRAPERFRARGIPRYHNNNFGKFPNRNHSPIRRYPILFPRNNYNENNLRYNNFQNHKKERPFNIIDLNGGEFESRAPYRRNYFRENFSKEFNPVNCQRNFIRSPSEVIINSTREILKTSNFPNYDKLSFMKEKNQPIIIENINIEINNNNYFHRGRSFDDKNYRFNKHKFSRNRYGIEGEFYKFNENNDSIRNNYDTFERNEFSAKYGNYNMMNKTGQFFGNNEYINNIYDSFERKDNSPQYDNYSEMNNNDSFYGNNKFMSNKYKSFERNVSTPKNDNYSEMKNNDSFYGNNKFMSNKYNSFERNVRTPKNENYYEMNNNDSFD